MPYQSYQSLGQLAAFVAVVEANGFTAAARGGHARKATLSERVQELEQRLGVSLLVRTTRSLRLTDEGRAYLEHARRSLAAARDAETMVTRAKTKPSGLLRVTLHPALASTLLETVLTPYLSRYPDVSVQIDTSLRRFELIRERYDVAVRIGSLSESSPIARRLGVTTGGYYANPQYLSSQGVPKRPEDLSRHATIVIPRDDELMEWPFIVGGEERAIVVRPRLTVSSFELAARAAAAGAGVLRSPRYFVQPFLAKKQLVAVLEKWTPPGVDVHAVFPPGAALVPKTRVFLDMLSEWFRRDAANM